MMRSPWPVSTVLLFLLLIVFGACSEDDPLVPPADTIAPTVVSTVPADSAAAVGLSTAVSATFSESMDAQTVSGSSFTLLLQQTDPVEGTVSLAGNVATFTPDQPLIAGVEYLARLDATVADRSGNTLQDEYVWRFTTGALAVTGVDPRARAVGVPLNSTVVAVFSERIDVASANATTFLLSSDRAEVAGSVSVSAGVVTFTPSDPLEPLTQYTATLTTGLLSSGGNRLAQNVQWSFTTGALSVVATTPDDAAQDVAANTQIRVTFSEGLDEDTLDSDSFSVRAGSSVVAGSFQPLSGGLEEVVFAPAAPLAPQTPYTVTITPELRALSGNQLAADHTFSFETGALTVVSTVPAASASDFAANGEVRATLSESISAASVSTNSFRLTGTSAVSGSVSVSGAVLTFSPNSNLAPGATYTAELTEELRGASTGNRLAAPFQWSFTTSSALPIADAGPDTDYSLGDAIALDGTDSTDPQGIQLTYAWTQISGPTVSFNSSQASPTLSNLPQQVCTLRFRLVVTNLNGPSAPDDVLISILENKSRRYFVSKSGNDANSGSRTAPLASIQEAIDRAMVPAGRLGIGDVYVAEGNYTAEGLVLASQVSIYGGFDPVSWERDLTSTGSVISAANTFNAARIAVRGVGVSDVRLDGLTIESRDGVSPGISSVGVYLTGSTQVVIDGCVIRAGRGEDGLDGNDGGTGNSGSNGSKGSDGGTCAVACDCSGGLCRSGGSGASSGSNRAGGSGGDAGSLFGCDGANGNGSAGTGGAGGTLVNVNGEDGDDGGEGNAGGNGNAGFSFGAVSIGSYVVSSGFSGSAGSSGGGGGGGGGGAGNTNLCGGGGGGGGSGGLGGSPGIFGRGGGGSFGMMVLDGSSVSISDTHIHTADGGSGGRGGTGGAGGPGGSGGSGGADIDAIATGGRGGNGGAGGPGGRGGHGGGGGGGPSIGIVEDAASSTQRAPSLQYTLGNGGAGGASQGNAGATGQRVERRKL